MENQKSLEQVSTLTHLYSLIISPVQKMTHLKSYHTFLSDQSTSMSLVMRKPACCICENKDADQLRELISAFVFATRIVQSLYSLNLKSQVSNNLLWLYSPVCVGPGRKPRRPVFSQRGSYHYHNYEPRCEETGLRWFPTRSDTNQAVQPQKIARALKFRI